MGTNKFIMWGGGGGRGTGNRNTHSRFMLQKLEIRSGLMGHLAPMHSLKEKATPKNLYSFVNANKNLALSLATHQPVKCSFYLKTSSPKRSEIHTSLPPF